MSAVQNSKDIWDKFKIGFEILAIIAIIIYGNVISTSLKEREMDLEFVKVAVEILQTEPNKTTEILREWAIEIIDDLSSSRVPLSDKVKKELLQKQLPNKWADKSIWRDSDTWEEK